MIDQRERISARPQRTSAGSCPRSEYRLRPSRLGGTRRSTSSWTQRSTTSIEREPAPPVGDEEPVEPASSTAASTWPHLSIPLSDAVVAVGEGRSGRPRRPTTPTARQPGFTGELGGATLFETGIADRRPELLAHLRLRQGPLRKLKHIVEPRIDYAYVGEFDERQQISLFDEIDRFRPLNGAVFSPHQPPAGQAGGRRGGRRFEIVLTSSWPGLQPRRTRPASVERSANADLRRAAVGPAAHQPEPRDQLSRSRRLQTLWCRRTAVRVGLGRHEGRPPLAFGSHATTQLARAAVRRHGADRSATTSTRPRAAAPVHQPSRSATASPSSSEVSSRSGAAETDERARILNQRYVLDWQAACYRWTLELRETNYRDDRGSRRRLPR